jgi:D-apionolactonase
MNGPESVAFASGRALTDYELWYGRNEPPPERTALCAGSFTAFLEGADLRDLRFGGVELVRRLHFTLRDENWDTLPVALKNFSISADANSFLVSFDAQNRNHEIDFLWHATIQGEPSGKTTYSMSGQALRGFRYCRIGFCVLHPPQYAGRPYRGTTPSGCITGELPQTIGPQRYEGGLYFPLFDAVSSLTVSLPGGVEPRFDFEGDLFEMEDQRNWTDGSFKTYCTPLSLGYPHTASAGQKFAQRVSITASGKPSASDDSRGTVNLSLGPPLAMRLPQLGLGIATHDEELSRADKEVLGELHLDHLRADLHLSHRDSFGGLERAEQECFALGCDLELALFLTDNARDELLALESRLPLSVPLARVLVFHEQEPTTSQQWVQQVRDRLAPHLPGVQIGGGTNLYFADLNRSRPNTEGLDAVAYSINPQVHASDERSLVENLEAQRDTVTTARTFCGGLPVVVSPVTLKPRFNPDAVGPEAAPLPGELPSAVDARQMSLFAAAWTLGSTKQLAEGGAASVTYYETTGWRGIKETDRGSPLPEVFLSKPGLVFPVYHIFADIGGLRTAELIACSSTDPLRVQGLALSNGGVIHLLVANLTADTQTYSVKPVSGEGARVRLLDASTVSFATAQPSQFRSQFSQAPISDSTLTLSLAPYGVARIELRNANGSDINGSAQGKER